MALPNRVDPTRGVQIQATMTETSWPRAIAEELRALAAAPGAPLLRQVR